MRWKGLDILAGVAAERLEQAKRDAESHADPVLPALPYTEGNPRWVLLYDHARLGQIRPDRVQKMRRDDLEYLAGMTDVHPALSEDQATKLRGNVARARDVLHRRSVRRTGLLSALVGATTGTVIGFLLHAAT